MAYKIIRHFRHKVTGDGWKRTVERGLTLEQAQAHCHDPETSSTTATGPAARRIQKRVGSAVVWFDGYTEAR